MKINFLSFLRFTKQPIELERDFLMPSNKKLIDTLVIIPIFGFLISSCLWLFVTTLKDFNVFTFIETDFNSHRGLIFNLLITVVITPIVEELIFRFPIKYLPKKKYYSPLIYLNIIIFGLIHFVNYETDTNGKIFALLIVSPQIFIGLLLTYVRIKYGFRFSVLTHSMYNLLGFFTLYLV